MMAATLPHPPSLMWEQIHGDNMKRNDVVVSEQRYPTICPSLASSTTENSYAKQHTGSTALGLVSVSAHFGLGQVSQLVS